MSVKVVDVPLQGPAAECVPKLSHECALSGLRLVALPPGEVELKYVGVNHAFDVNLNGVRHELSIGSDPMRAVECPAESIAFIPAEVEFRLRTNNLLWGLILELDPTRAGDLAAEALDGAAFPSDFMEYTTDPQAGLLGRLLIQHLRRSSIDRLYAEGLGLAILGRGLQLGLNIPDISTDTADRRIERVMDFIDANLAVDLSMAQLSMIACMSPWHFSRCFKAATGESPHKWVMHRRTDRAVELIRFTREPLAEIAHRCGFSSQSHMGAAVKSMTRASPAALRNE